MTFGKKRVKTSLPDAEDKAFKGKKNFVNTDIKDPFDNPMEILDSFDDFEKNDFGKTTVKGIFGGIQGIDEVKPKTKNLTPLAKKGKKKFEKKSSGMDIFGGVDDAYDFDGEDPFKF